MLLERRSLEDLKRSWRSGWKYSALGAAKAEADAFSVSGAAKRLRADEGRSGASWTAFVISAVLSQRKSAW